MPVIVAPPDTSGRGTPLRHSSLLLCRSPSGASPCRRPTATLTCMTPVAPRSVPCMLLMLLMLLPWRLLMPHCHPMRSSRRRRSSSSRRPWRHRRSSSDRSPWRRPHSSSCLNPARRLLPSPQRCSLAPLSRTLLCQLAIVMAREWLPGKKGTAEVGLRRQQQQPRPQLRAMPPQPCCRGSPSRPRDGALGLSRRPPQLASGSRLAPSRAPTGRGISSRCRAALTPSNSPVPSQP